MSYHLGMDDRISKLMRHVLSNENVEEACNALRAARRVQATGVLPTPEIAILGRPNTAGNTYSRAGAAPGGFGTAAGREYWKKYEPTKSTRKFHRGMEHWRTVKNGVLVRVINGRWYYIKMAGEGEEYSLRLLRASKTSPDLDLLGVFKSYDSLIREVISMEFPKAG